MQAYRIKGGNRLIGSIEVKGSKNAALAVMSGLVLVNGTVHLTNVPDLSDTRAKARLLEKFGARVQWEKDNVWIDCSNIHPGEADESVVRSIRTSFYLLGPLLARIGKVVLPSPGGCKIGARPVDFHLKGLELLGAKIELIGGVYYAEANGLRGAEIYLDFPSPGATQHLMSAATLASGATVIDNAAMEPEVTALADFLNALGARIEGAGTSKITIQGVTSLKGANYRIPADRLQAGTYMLGAAITGGDVTVTGVLPEHQTALTKKLGEANVKVTEGSDWIRVEANQELQAIKVMTMPYPGFATDMQQPMAALLCIANGTSILEETIYESRIGHVQELNRMGAKIRIEGRVAIITGIPKFKGATVEASDLRAGAALVLASLAAEGTSTVRNIHHIVRGYQDLVPSLTSLGATIEEVSSGDREGLPIH